METTLVEQISTMFEGVVTDVIDFIVGFLPVVVPLLILSIGIPMGIKYIRKLSNASKG